MLPLVAEWVTPLIPVRAAMMSDRLMDMEPPPCLEKRFLCELLVEPAMQYPRDKPPLGFLRFWEKAIDLHNGDLLNFRRGNNP
jgi:hypothetical protein